MVVYGRIKLGRHYTITGSDAVSGSEISYTVPAGKIWNLKSATFTMWAGSGSSGTARSPYLVITGSDGYTNYQIYCGHDYVSGSGVTTYYWIAGLPSDTLHTGSIVVTPIPNDVILLENYVIKTSTTGFGTTDNWTAPAFYVEEWEA